MADWKDLCVLPGDSIETAIRRIEEGAMRIALVVDSARRLLGTVTDGDVRRGLMQHIGLGEPVERIMNSTPKIMLNGGSREEALELMRINRVLQMPIVDRAGRLVGIETLETQAPPPPLRNEVLLLAGGFGKRLRPLTEEIPKPMLKIGSKPILESIIEMLAASGFEKFHVAVHYRSEMIKSYFGDGSDWKVSIDYIEEPTPLGTAGALSLLRVRPRQPMLVMNADLVTRVNFRDLVRFHDETGAAATLCGLGYDYEVPFGVIDVEGPRVSKIVEKPIQRYLVSAGIYMLSPQVFSQLVPGAPLAMPDLLQRLIDTGESVACFPLHEYWLDVGSIGDFERAECHYGRVKT